MDLIERKELKEYLGIGGTKTSCRRCQYKDRWGVCDLDKVPSFVDVCTAIDDAPEVEAIPVEWLENFRDGLDTLSESRLMHAIDLIIDAYIVEKKREEHGSD
mgnify:CR=1 FL=1